MTLAGGYPQTPDFSPFGQKIMKTDSENRTVFHTVRFSPAEAVEVAEHASVVGLSISALIRARVLGHPLPRGAAPAINLTAWRELASCASNFNQLSRHLNTAALAGGQPVLDFYGVKDLVLEVEQNLKKVRLQLLGTA